MPEITTKIFSVTFESLFKSPVIFKEAHCDEIAKKCYEVFSSYFLKPNQIIIRRGDEGYNYDVSFSLFNGNASFKISADKLEVNFINANGKKDLEVVADCVVKIFNKIPISQTNITTIAASSHASFTSLEERKKFHDKFSVPQENIHSGGAIAYLFCNDWPKEIRLTIDLSAVYPDGVFLDWTTVHVGEAITQDVMLKLAGAWIESLGKFGLKYADSKLE